MLSLRKYRQEDGHFIPAWFKDETEFRKWCIDRYEKYPVTADDINRYYERCANDNFCVFTAEDEGKVVGHMVMRVLDTEKPDIRFCLIVIDGTNRGKGSGTAMLREAMDYAKDFLHAKTVSVGVFENNEAAYRCYIKLGFEETGVTEEYDIMGEHWRYHILSRQIH